MRFIDTYDEREYSTADLMQEWKAARQEEPENHAANFRTEFFEILMATVNGRNDLDIIGPTPRELSAIIDSLRATLPEDEEAE